jgi:hypothetical protein
LYEGARWTTRYALHTVQRKSLSLLALRVPPGAIIPKMTEHDSHLQYGPAVRPAPLGGRAAWYCVLDQPVGEHFTRGGAVARIMEDYKYQLDIRNAALRSMERMRMRLLQY